MDEIQDVFPDTPLLTDLPSPAIRRPPEVARGHHGEQEEGVGRGGGGGGEVEGEEGGPREYVDLNEKRGEFYRHCKHIREYLDPGDDADFESYLVEEKNLVKFKGYVFDIVTGESQRCSCFTKSYGKYVRGTGSVRVSSEHPEMNERTQIHALRNAPVSEARDGCSPSRS